MKLHSLRLLGSESVAVVAGYGAGIVLKSLSPSLGMLTSITKPLSKPGRPQVMNQRTEREDTA